MNSRKRSGPNVEALHFLYVQFAQTNDLADHFDKLCVEPGQPGQSQSFEYHPDGNISDWIEKGFQILDRQRKLEPLNRLLITGGPQSDESKAALQKLSDEITELIMDRHILEHFVAVQEYKRAIGTDVCFSYTFQLMFCVGISKRNVVQFLIFGMFPGMCLEQNDL